MNFQRSGNITGPQAAIVVTLIIALVILGAIGLSRPQPMAGGGGLGTCTPSVSSSYGYACSGRGATIPCTYDVYKDGATYSAKNCKTGTVDFQSTSFSTIWTGILANNVALYFEPATYDTGGGVSIIDFSGVSLWGNYNKTTFTCTVAACIALAIGNQNAVDNIYHAKSVDIRDMTFDGGAPTITNGAAMGISTSFDIRITHCIFENSYEIATGGFRLTNWNAQQILSKDILIQQSLFLSQKITVSGVLNGFMNYNVFQGMPPNPTHRAFIDFSKGDFSPIADNMVSNFEFNFNTVYGWSDTGGGFLQGMQAVNNDSIIDNYVETSSKFTTVGVTGPVLNGMTVAYNTFTKATGGMTFDYGSNIAILYNQWLGDLTPSNFGIAISIGGGATISPNIPSDVVIAGNQISKYGGIGMLLNFSRGAVYANDVFDVNQGNGNVNSESGIVIEKGLTNVQIYGNTIVSDVASGAGNSNPVQYLTAGKNVTLTTNTLQAKSNTCAQGTGINFGVTADPTFQAYQNSCFNPYGKRVNFILAGSGIGLCGTASTVVASVDYQVCGFPILITSTGGTGVSITIKDFAGNSVASALTTLTAQYLPIGFKINFGGFSVAPTVTVFGS